jgi:hypothetical protein
MNKNIVMAYFAVVRDFGITLDRTLPPYMNNAVLDLKGVDPTDKGH